MRRFLLLLAALAAAVSAQPRKLLVISIDGLDQRYLEDRAALGLKIPNLRKITENGQFSRGVVGIVPTVTWPSHTTIITGATAAQHGILSNKRGEAQGGDYYWTVDLLKSRTLWHALADARRTSAAITWPVTVNARIDWNLPEFFRRRNGGAMDLAAIAEKSTPGLVDAIAKDHPSFRTEWMDDRTRALATAWILKNKQPDLTLLHFVDHDSAAHDNSPFTPAAKAQLEYTDELVGLLLAAMPKGMAVALVSDHGFEKVDRELNLAAFLDQSGLRKKAENKGPLEVYGGFVTTKDPEVIAALRAAAKDPKGCVSREIPRDEVARFLPQFDGSVFDAAPGCYYLRGTGSKEIYGRPDAEAGKHGHWPTRYRAVFALYGDGIRAERLPEIDMLSIANRLAAVLGLKESFPAPIR
jgi:predicted AlkP superfamily pyrophosphatase or phosphodiesterase